VALVSRSEPEALPSYIRPRPSNCSRRITDAPDCPLAVLLVKPDWENR
jgi:hypothetical protein